MLLGLGCVFMTTGFYLATPWVMKFAVDSLNESVTQDKLLFYGGLIVGLTVLQGVFRFMMRWLMIGVSRRIEYRLRGDVFEHLERLGLSFFQESQVGDLMARATNDVEAIQRFLEHAFRMALTGVMTFFLSLALMCTIDWSLAVLALLPMPIMVGTARLLSPKMRRGYRRIQEQFGSMSSHVQENLSGMRVVKAFARREAEIDEFTISPRFVISDSVSVITEYRHRDYDVGGADEDLLAARVLYTF